MKRTWIGALAVACALVFALAGCSGSSSASGQAAGSGSGSNAAQGYWIMESSDAIGFEGFLDIADDNNVELLLADSYLMGKLTDSTIAFEDYDEESTGLSGKVAVSGDKLTLGTSGSSSLVFKRSTEDEFMAALGFDEEGSAEGMDGQEGAEASGDSTGDEVNIEGMEVVDEVIEDYGPMTVTDDGNCTITVTGKGTDFTNDPGYRLSITNKTDKVIYVTAEEDFTINGKSLEAGLGEVVEAGETVEAFMYFSRDDLGAGPEGLVNITGKINVEEDETYNEIAAYDFHID